MKYRDFHDDPNAPRPAELILKSVEERRIGKQIVGGQSDRRKIISPRHVHLLLVDFRSKLQAFQFLAVCQSRVHIAFGKCVGQGKVSHIFIGKPDFGIERQSAQLAKQHFRQAQPVFHLHQSHFRLVHLHPYAQCIGLGGNAFFHHFVHIRI